MNKSVIRIADEQTAEIRRQRVLDAKRRKQAFLDENPALRNLENELRIEISSYYKQKLTGKNPDGAKMQALEKQIDEYYSSHKLSRSQFEIIPFCRICNDTGRVDKNGKQEFCVCFKQRLFDIAYKDSTNSNQTFETFDINVFAEGEVRQNMETLKSFCEKYANRFPENKHANIILSGQTGVGKTFLLNCIAKRVIERGNSVISISAGRLFDELRKYALSQIDNIDDLLEADLLLIDDLGTEPLYNNITNEFLFLLFTERLRTNRPMVITTNLTPVQIGTRYTDRIASRLLDKNVTATINVTGDDQRLR